MNITKPIDLLLKEKVHKWNEHRALYPGTQPNLDGVIFNNLNLKGVNLSGCNLTGTKFVKCNFGIKYLSDEKSNIRRAIINGAEFVGCNLNWTSFYGSVINDTNYFDSSVNSACFSRCRLFDCELSNLKGEFQDYSESTVEDCLFNKIYAEITNLSTSNIKRSNIDKCTFIDSNFQFSKIVDSNFVGCNLSKSDFENANLLNICFNKTSFRSMFLSDTTFTNCDLSGAKYLSSCNYFSSSHIDADSMKRTGCKISEEFLRGIGMSDWEAMLSNLYRSNLGSSEIVDIIYEVHNLKTSNPIQFYSCFISYSHEDEKFARYLHRRLQSDGLHVYFAPHSMLPGKKIKNQIDEAVVKYDKLLLILSLSSIKSNWVMYELRKAYETEVHSNKRILFPIALTGYKNIKEWGCFDDEKAVDYAKEVRSYYIPDFSKWKNKTSFDREYNKLMKSLKTT